MKKVLLLFLIVLLGSTGLTCMDQGAHTAIQQARNAVANGGMVPILNDALGQNDSRKDFRAHGVLGPKAQIHHAIASGYLTEVEAMLKAGADPNELDGSGNTPLDALMTRPMHDGAPCHEFAQALIEAGADVNKKSPGTRMHPIHLAVKHLVVERCLLPVLDALIKAGACPNQKSLGGDTALHVAVRRKNACAVEFLLKHNVDLNITNDAGFTPLQIVALSYTGSPFYPNTKIMYNLLISGAQCKKESTLRIINFSSGSSRSKAISFIGSEIAARDATRTLFMATQGRNSVRASPAGSITLHDALLIKTFLEDQLRDLIDW